MKIKIGLLTQRLASVLLSIVSLLVLLVQGNQALFVIFLLYVISLCQENKVNSNTILGVPKTWILVLMQISAHQHGETRCILALVPSTSSVCSISLFSDSIYRCFCKMFWLMGKKSGYTGLQEISFIGQFDLFFSLLHLDTNI